MKKTNQTKEETNLYFQYLKEGQVEYRNKIVMANYGLVVYLASKYINSEFELDDLTNIGVIGLIKAVDSFKLDNGIAFATYASKCIINEIFMAFRHKKNWISLSDFEYEFSDGRVISLEDEMKDDYDLEKTVIDAVCLQQDVVLLKKMLSSMELRNREILLDYFGIGRTSLSQDQIAGKHHVSQSLISRIIAKSLKDLKVQMNFELEVNQLQKLLTKK